MIEHWIGVTGGKGGVGKTHVAASIGFAMAETGRSVLLVDGDLGLGGVDVLLGLDCRFDVGDVLDGRCGVEDALVLGPAGVHVLPARSGSPRLASLDPARRADLLALLVEIGRDYDRVLLDTPAGVAGQALELASLAGRALVVTSPEPTALADAYAVLKLSARRQGLENFELVVNQGRSDEEETRAASCLQAMAHRFLDASVALGATIPHDGHLPRAVRRQRLVLDLYPEAPSARRLRTLARSLLSRPVPTAESRSTP